MKTTIKRLFWFLDLLFWRLTHFFDFPIPEEGLREVFYLGQSLGRKKAIEEYSPQQSPLLCPCCGERLFPLTQDGYPIWVCPMRYSLAHGPLRGPSNAAATIVSPARRRAARRDFARAAYRAA